MPRTQPARRPLASLCSLAKEAPHRPKAEEASRIIKAIEAFREKNGHWPNQREVLKFCREELGHGKDKVMRILTGLLRTGEGVLKVSKDKNNSLTYAVAP